MSNAIRNFIIGMGSVLDLRPVEDVEAELGRLRRTATDRQALEQDWKMVGDDLWRAINRYERDRSRRCG